MNTPPARKSAFTFLELLASLAIVAVLAAVALGAVARLRNAQRETACVSNLRHLGLAIITYCNDNSFLLPGPLWRGQSPLYHADEEGNFDTASGNLAGFLAPYLHLHALAPGGTALAQALACPAWRSGDGTQTQPICYYSAGEIALEEGELLFPFGRSGGDPLPPERLTAIPSPALTPAFWEFDKHAVVEGFYLTDPRVPNAPVHKTVRNVLYFDGHAAPQPVAL